MNTIVGYFKRPGEFRKAYIWLVAFLASLIASGLLHGTVYHYVAVGLTLLGFIGGTIVKNDAYSSDQAATPTAYTAPPVTGE